MYIYIYIRQRAEAVEYCFRPLLFWKIRVLYRQRNCQKATAAAAATLSESTWCAMGIRTT